MNSQGNVELFFPVYYNCFLAQIIFIFAALNISFETGDSMT